MLESLLFKIQHFNILAIYLSLLNENLWDQARIYVFLFFSFLRFAYFYWKDIFREKERQREISSVHWFTSQLSTMVGAEPVWNQEPKASFMFPIQVQAIFDYIPRSQAGSCMGSGAAAISTRVIWDPGTCKARSLFGHLATAPGPAFHLLKR